MESGLWFGDGLERKGEPHFECNMKRTPIESFVLAAAVHQGER